ncbi:SAM-dependent methyltransferase [Bradyrhizobium genomosp. I (2014)]|uniref:SAM-dependent methyltransferase n=1 Tax=Bradyrhizobium genomosp. I (2014) TaxID=2683269 RepID=UPI00054DB63D|nr:SAM-dependent methyltransferase [Bradyrhizobium sp. CCBAU 43298]
MEADLFTMPTTDPDGFCPCESGLLYRDCHQAVREASPEDVLDVGRRVYADRWGTNAGFYEKQGLYRKLADHLFSFTRATKVIDIGCGRGEGLAALVEAAGAGAHLFVGLDENPDCLAAAARRLGVGTPDTRLRRVGLDQREYDLEFVPGRLPAPGRIVLAQTDLLRQDPELDELLLVARPYDAVTQWFSGMHSAREHDRIMKDMQIGSDRVHRMATDLAALEYAANAVRDGGIFHVVTRVAGDDVRLLREDTAEEVGALASHGPITLEELVLLPYTEPPLGPRIGVGAPGSSYAAKSKFAASAIFRLDQSSA